MTRSPAGPSGVAMTDPSGLTAMVMPVGPDSENGRPSRPAPSRSQAITLRVAAA